MHEVSDFLLWGVAVPLAAVLFQYAAGVDTVTASFMWCIVFVVVYQIIDTVRIVRSI